MLFFIRYTKGLGDNALYTRLRNASGQYWDFSDLAWSNSEAISTKILLAETQDNDTVESLYSGEAASPSGGPWIEEVVVVSTGRVIGYDNSATPVESIQLTLKQLLYSYVGDVDNVFSKICGSFVGQINFYATSYEDFAANAEAPNGTLLCTLSSTGVMSNINDIETDGNVLYMKLSSTFSALADIIINVYQEANKGNLRVYIPKDTAYVSANYSYYPTTQGGLLVYENGNLIQFGETAYGKAIGMIPNIDWERISQPVILTTTQVLD